MSCGIELLQAKPCLPCLCLQARCEQDEESLRKHRQFDTPFALLPKDLSENLHSAGNGGLYFVRMYPKSSMSLELWVLSDFWAMNFTSLKGRVLSNLYCAQRIWTIPRRRRAIWIRTTLRVHVAGVLSCIMFFLQMVFYKTQDCQENRGTLPRWKQATASICIRTIVFFAVCEGFSVTFCDKSYHWGGYISISKDPPEMPTLPKNRLWKKKRDVFDKQQTWGLDLWISPFTASNWIIGFQSQGRETAIWSNPEETRDQDSPILGVLMSEITKL